jgi:hypothetical protein
MISKQRTYVTDLIKRGFRRARWEQLDRKEKDYWRGRVQQWNQDRVTPNMQYSPRPHRS